MASRGCTRLRLRPKAALARAAIASYTQPTPLDILSREVDEVLFVAGWFWRHVKKLERTMLLDAADAARSP